MGKLSYARAHWVARSLIAWDVNVEDTICYLYASKSATLFLTEDGIEGHDMKIQVEQDIFGLPLKVIEKFPHIADYKAFKIPYSVDIKSLLKCQLAIASFSENGKCSDATGLQLPGVLDDLFSYSGPLGAVFTREAVSLYLWSPTAQVVCACIYRDPSGGDPLVKVQLDEANGVWSVNGPRSWEGCYYAYEVSIYHPGTLQIETCRVNDPYARGLSADGERTLLVNLDSDSLKPQGWDELADEKPDLPSFSDITIYELHIRDFSANDKTVNPEFCGGYLAFTCEDSAGVCHLRKLRNAGLSHVHLLPSFHFAGVDDEKEKWKHIDDNRLATLPPDSDEQQAEVVAIQDEDGYNWGYNPVLWGVPKGSYASSPNGPCRTLEFRKMVQAINRIGLRVVLDVVYNHLHASGPLDRNSVLDKVVPGYYLRRNADGCIEHSTCTNNTASEHFMVERLILDDLLCWAVDYKVDGFRFDLMGHIMKSTMVKAKCALFSLSKEFSGVDGSKIYIYGEGWDFGEVAENGRGVNASQFNICGTGIGSFNDRIRDAVLGGSPFGHPLQQGFATGLSLQPNEHDQGSKPVMDNALATLKDHIQVGLAANLRDFVFTSHKGEAVKGCEVLTHDGLPVAYALCPTETVNYVSAHDNETLFDIVSLKTPFEVSVGDRCRINHLATSIVALSQGIPFFHAGDEMLRSKSLDRDSYNSGDWFNRLDFSYQTNNWGVGLPPKEKNEKNWPLIKPRLADSSFKPLKSHILAAVDNFRDLLKIRYSSPLFRLRTAASIQERVRFHNTGTSWVPGVIVMSIEDGYEGMPGLSQLDPIYSYIVVVFNACPSQVSFVSYALRERTLQLHPVQLMSSDELIQTSSYESHSGCFIVPPWTTSVFVETRKSD
ncbi:Glycoside hydrolase [Cinnamomum micranthum f. kanehirae]|uniref:Glycoside hydrolase n=1 Tax=Cinnamomum micranthum f. kanehirae TaxID=337451 RepID=A0A443N8W0_9MAGN|nr:Glycoside hydrolase [Cinnamomum micranthum f. kanehirae]